MVLHICIWAVMAGLTELKEIKNKNNLKFGGVCWGRNGESERGKLG